MLRKETKERFLNILRGNKLTIHCFEVKFQASDQPMMEVQYLLNKNFTFELGYDGAGAEIPFWVRRCPSRDLVSPELRAYRDLDTVVSAFQEWLNFVEVEDEVPNDLDSDVKTLKEQFFKELGKIIKDEDSFFTREEAEVLASRIDELEQKLAEVLKAQQGTANDLETVKKKVRDAKKDIPNMTKRKWKWIGGGKILDAMLAIAKSREGRKTIFGGFAKLLSDVKPN